MAIYMWVNIGKEMACCLTEEILTSHWWVSVAFPRSDFTESAQTSILYDAFKIALFRLLLNLTWVSELTHLEFLLPYQYSEANQNVCRLSTISKTLSRECLYFDYYKLKLAPGIHCSFAGFTTVWGGSVANTSPPGYQKSLQCWKIITILLFAIFPFYVENTEFLIKATDVKKPLYRINGLLVIIYDGHVVKWQSYYKHMYIVIVCEIKFKFLKLSTYHLFPKWFWLFVTTLRQRVVVQYNPWRPSWKMAAILETTLQYSLVSITLKLHFTCAYKFYRMILFDWLLLFSK